MNRAGLLVSVLSAPVALASCAGQPGEPPTAVRVERVEVARDGHPYFVRGELAQLGDSIDSAARTNEALAAVLPAIAQSLGAPSAELVAGRSERDELGMTHVRLTQRKNGLRVVSGDAIAHIDAAGVVREVNGSIRDRDLPSTPSITAEDAVRLAIAANEVPATAVRHDLAYLVSNRDGELYLAWEVATSTRKDKLVEDLIYVDALTGDVVDRHPQVFTVKSRVVTNGANGVFPVAGAATIGTETSPPTDAVALAAFNNVGATYDCYKTLYNRDSYNNAGAQLASQVHVVFDYGDGTTSPNNAVWASDVSMMAYGDGDGVQMKQLAYAFDVTAHELTHAVTGSTANLVYQNESGALNEGMSDIMASVCEAWKTKTVNAASTFDTNGNVTTYGQVPF